MTDYKSMIETVTAYRYNGKVYPSLRVAANKIAWSVIMVKYGLVRRGDAIHTGAKCRCHESYSTEDDYINGWEDCPIHDRKTGYLKRVHRRLARMIFAQVEHAAEL